MTKEEILNREYTTQFAGNTALLMRLFPEKDNPVVLAAMDEYAKQQAIAFVKWAIEEEKIIGEDRNPAHMPLMEEDIYTQFIEQQNKP